MATALLIIIYVVFISLGLPDSVLGSSFPAISQNVGISPEINGYLSMIISCCTIVSSLGSAFFLKRIKTPIVIASSICLTVLGLVLFGLTKPAYPWLFYVACLPLGLGAGAIDSALNNYVALHYKAIHMNWLHASWGVGVSVSPLIIGSFIDPNANSRGWDKGVLTLAIIQAVILVIVLVSLPLWGKAAKASTKAKAISNEATKKESPISSVSLKPMLKSPVLYFSLLGFACYCALEGSTGLWIGNYFRYGHGLDTDQCAMLTSTFFIGITVGRFISGVLSLKVKEAIMIRLGESFIAAGVVLALMGYFNAIVPMVGFAVIGLGCAPIYPAIIKSTPYRFSKALSPRIMGFEMASAYLGNLIVPPVFGVVAKAMGNNYLSLPILIAALAAVMILSHEIVNASLRKRDKSLTPKQREDFTAA